MTGTTPQQLTIEQALQMAVAHHQAGRLPEAEQLYRAILGAQPSHPDANHNLGVLAMQVGQAAAGLPHLKNALETNPSNGQYALSYAEALLSAGQAGDAIRVIESAIGRGLDSEAAQALRRRALNGLTDAPEAASDENRLIALYRAGRYAEMENQARLLLDRNRDSGFAWKALGAALQAQNKDALIALENAARLSPDDAESHNALGEALRNRGQPAAAAASCRRALEIKPDFAQAHNNLANALIDLGQFEEALASYRNAIAIQPDFPEAHYNLGNALKGLGQTENAMAAYRKALEIKPDFAQAHYNLGHLLNGLGRIEEALAAYRNALQAEPNYVQAHNELANTLKAIGRLPEAVASYRRALEIKPDFAQAHNNLGNALIGLGELDLAMSELRQAIANQPDFAQAYYNMGTILSNQGNLSEARANFRKAAEFGFAGARVREALLLPPIMGTREELLQSRAEFERNLDRLLAEAAPLQDPLNQAETNFYLAFHGLDDRDLQIKLAKYYEQACPSLLYSAPHCARPRSGAGKIRLGFLSSFFYSHSVSLCFSRLIESLAAKGPFEVTLISNRPVDESIYSAADCGRVCLPNDLERARAAVAALELDILVFLDIGMEPFSYFLAFARLARVQCVLAGHPVTTGIGNIDYFLSTDSMEPAGAENHYSEKLVRLPTPPVYFERPTPPASIKTRQQLGLPENRNLYLCPMKLQKLHPDFDEAIARILQLDGNGVIVLYQDQTFASWKEALLARFEKTIPAAVRERILFLPWLRDRGDFLSSIANASVVLDPFHFGIGSTAIATFACGTPFMTKPGDFMRGRVGLAFCKMLDLPECVAEDVETYARQAVRIACEPSLRDAIRAKIFANDHVLYENLQPVEDLTRFFCSALDKIATASPNHAKEPTR